VGDEEATSGQLSLKDMESGEQVKVTESELIQKLR
jgi:histidyl-tRNA synthetase